MENLNDSKMNFSSVNHFKQQEHRDITESYSLTNEEVRGFYDMLWSMLIYEDRTYEVWKYIRENSDETESEDVQVPLPDCTEKFMSMLEQNLMREYGSNVLDHYERAYQQEKVDFELYKTDGMNVRGRALYPYLSIINNSYKNRDDHDANIVNKLIEIVVKLTDIKFPVEDEQSQLVH